MLGAIARIAPARPAMPLNDQVVRWVAFNSNEPRKPAMGYAGTNSQSQVRSQKFLFSPAAASAESPLFLYRLNEILRFLQKV
jgi:hypothetical protein